MMSSEGKGREMIEEGDGRRGRVRSGEGREGNIGRKGMAKNDRGPYRQEGDAFLSFLI